MFPGGVEIVTVSLEMSGPEASRPYIDAAAAEHPSVLDPTHRMGELFGVVNIPNVVWIDEDGIIVRPAEAGWPGPIRLPPAMLKRLAASRSDDSGGGSGARRKGPDFAKLLGGGQDRSMYPDAIRDWALHGNASRWAMTPDQVVAASQPRSANESAAAAHFELASRLWRDGNRDAAIMHFAECHRLQPDNWTYKRQAWSAWGVEQPGGATMGRFNQNPAAGEPWPFAGSFDADVSELGPGEYYPSTM